jgi:hypothetical protein
MALSFIIIGRIPGRTVVYWSFDAGTDSVTVDSLGLCPGLLHGARPAWAQCGPGLQFDGQDDYVEVEDAPALDATDSLTLAAWVCPEDSMQWGMGIIDKSNFAGISGSYRLVISQVSWKPSFIIRIGGVDWKVEADSATGPGQWHHVAGTYDGARIRIYINGVLNKSYPQTGQLDVDAYPVRLGHYLGPKRYFAGTMDEVRIYDQALTQTEITALYSHCNTGIKRTPLPQGLVGDKGKAPAPGQVYDLQGRLRFPWPVNRIRDTQRIINSSSLPPGVYFIRIYPGRDELENIIIIK